MGKKNLEQLFKDTFKDFQKSPDEKVWKAIEATLDKKKNKKRVVPIWWQMGGVAALFAILFFAINPWDGSKETETNQKIQIVDTENQEKNEDSNSKDSMANPSQHTLADEEEKTEEEQSDDSSLFKLNKANSDRLVNSDESSRPSSLTEKEQPSNSSATLDKKVSPNEDAIAVVQDSKSDSERNFQNVDSNTKEAIAAVEENIKENESSINSLTKNSKTITEKETDVAKTDVEKNLKEELTEKKSIYDAIAEKNAEDEEELLAENTESKWSVGPSVAPVYFTGTGEGSPIHSNFRSNSKSGNLNLSYGLTVSYNLGKRLKVRSGVHRVDFGYDTNEIVFSSSLESSTNELIDNINYSETSRNLVVQSSKALPSATTADSFSEIQSNETPALDGKMVQQLGYIEVPLELNYALIDKKFGVDIIGGVSSLFLVDNTVLLESEELVTEVGEANNVNTVNFSTNVGLGLNYKVSPKVQLNLEPVFKYQLNTFSETAGPFRPFSVGVYSGVSFRF